MEKYEVIGLLGEGSFGRVYKAQQTADQKYVALKVISKRGRSSKELKGLRRECQIQKDLHHPNIIQMLDSFETENEIVVITEFAHKELYVILGKEGYLPEERVQAIVWDLVSALYYLHSHRVLHRDLKPQNILLDVNNTAKLCDFGFARNMSTGTHVLTSIKGTPLYMAPELIEELPYDHNADLWSLGCIIYELLVGAPPFCTASILHLIRLIRHEQIQWPNFLSEHCTSFLRGLLQKNPSKRLTWPELLHHPFVKGHILICDDSSAMALTRPLSANTLQAKEQQRKDHTSQKNPNLRLPSSKSSEEVKTKSKSNHSKGSKTSSKSNDDLKSNAQNKSVNKIADQIEELSIQSGENKNSSSKNDNEGATGSKNQDKSVGSNTIENKASCNKDGKINNIVKSIETKDTPEAKNNNASKNNNGTKNNKGAKDNNETKHNKEAKNSTEAKINNDFKSNEKKVDPVENQDERSSASFTLDESCIVDGDKLRICNNFSYNFHEDSHPLENEEWTAFLHRTTEEIINGEISSLLQPNFANIIISPLKNTNVSATVMTDIIILLSSAFNRGISETTIGEIKKVYLEVKVIPNLLYSLKLLLRNKEQGSNTSTPTPSFSPVFPSTESYKSVNDLSEDDLKALEHMFLFICWCVYNDVQFLSQFCDSIVVLKINVLLQQFLLLTRLKPKVVTDLMAILIAMLKFLPENYKLVHEIIMTMRTPNEESKLIINMLKHSYSLLRERTCYFLLYLSYNSLETLEVLWNDNLREILEDLVYDSIESVRNVAERVVEELKTLEFYSTVT